MSKIQDEIEVFEYSRPKKMDVQIIISSAKEVLFIDQNGKRTILQNEGDEV